MDNSSPTHTAICTEGGPRRLDVVRAINSIGTDNHDSMKDNIHGVLKRELIRTFLC